MDLRSGLMGFQGRPRAKSSSTAPGKQVIEGRGLHSVSTRDSLGIFGKESSSPCSQKNPGFQLNFVNLSSGGDQVSNSKLYL